MKILQYIILFIYTLNNFYFPVFLGIPIDIIINLFLIALLMILFKSYKLKVNKNFFFLIIIIGIYFSLNGIINTSINYPYQLVRNTLFILTTFYIFKSIQLNRVLWSIYSGLWLNNLIIIMQLLGLDFVYDLINNLESIFNFENRLDYRTNGIVVGPLKAGLITTFLFVHTLFFVNNKMLKIVLLLVLFFISILQARTAVVLILLALIIFLLSKYKSIITLNLKKIITIFILSIIFVISSNFIWGFMEENFDNFETTISWQMTELLNIDESVTVKVLTQGALSEVTSFYENQKFYLTLLGNGKSNWDGPNSVQSDNGYATQMVGLGVLGLILLILVYIYLFYNLVTKLRHKEAITGLFIIFTFLFIMNFKSTSFMSYHYFNLFMLYCYFFMYNYKKGQN